MPHQVDSEGRSGLPRTLVGRVSGARGRHSNKSADDLFRWNELCATLHFRHTFSLDTLQNHRADLQY